MFVAIITILLIAAVAALLVVIGWGLGYRAARQRFDRLYRVEQDMRYVEDQWPVSWSFVVDSKRNDMKWLAGEYSKAESESARAGLLEKMHKVDAELHTAMYRHECSINEMREADRKRAKAAKDREETLGSDLSDPMIW